MISVYAIFHLLVSRNALLFKCNVLKRHFISFEYRINGPNTKYKYVTAKRWKENWHFYAGTRNVRSCYSEINSKSDLSLWTFEQVKGANLTNNTYLIAIHSLSRLGSFRNFSDRSKNFAKNSFLPETKRIDEKMEKKNSIQHYRRKTHDSWLMTIIQWTFRLIWRRKKIITNAVRLAQIFECRSTCRSSLEIFICLMNMWNVKI